MASSALYHSDVLKGDNFRVKATPPRHMSGLLPYVGSPLWSLCCYCVFAICWKRTPKNLFSSSIRAINSLCSPSNVSVSVPP